MSNIRNCDRCQRPLDGVAVGGLCPNCLAALAHAPWFDPEAADSGLVDLAQVTGPSPTGMTPKACPSHLPDASPPVGYFGDYELLEEIARGGMGVIYRARQASLDRIVAIKMIRAGVLASELDIVRFSAEARAAAGLRHPSIVAIHEVGEVEDRHYFSMEFVAGRNLAACVREGPWVGKRAARCLRTVAAAVDYAHRQGILHRDLKPSNVIIDEAGEPHLTDFGLATQIEGASALTLSGIILGTPSYMAPEQTGGRRTEIGPRTDVYALGAILYEVLTGRPPFQGETPLNTIQLVRDTEAVPLRRLNPRIPADLETICLKCLEKDPRRRYATAQDLADDLGRFLNDEPIRARPVRAWEHGWKWVRRNPWRAALAAASVVILLGTLGLILQVTKRRELEALYDREKDLRRSAEDLKLASEEARASALIAASGERKAREEEAAQRRIAETTLAKLEQAYSAAQKSGAESRLFYYVAQIPLAQQAWEANNPIEAIQLLNQCPEEHRLWEWHYLKKLFHTKSAEIARFTAATNGLVRVAVSPDGSRVAGTGSSGVLQWVDLISGTATVTPKVQANLLEALAFGTRRDWLAVATGFVEPDRLSMINLEDATLIRSFRGIPDRIRGLAFAEADQILLSSGDAGLISWETSTGAKRWEIPTTHPTVGLGVVVSPDNRSIAWITGNGRKGTNQYGEEVRLAGDTFQVLESTQGRVLRVQPGGNEEIQVMAFSPDSALLATGHDGGVIRILDTRSGSIRRGARHGYGRLETLAFSPDGKSLISGSSDGTIAIQPVNNVEDSGLRIYRGQQGPVRSVFPEADGSHLIVVGTDGSISRLAIDRPQDGLTVQIEGNTLAFLDNERLLLDGAHMVSASTGELMQVAAQERQTGRVAFAERGDWMAIGDRVLNLNSTNGAWTTISSNRFSYACAFSQSGGHLALGGQVRNQRHLQVLEVGTWLDVTTIPIDDGTNYVYDVAFAQDDRLLAMAVGRYHGAIPGEVQLWDWKASQLTARFPSARFCVLSVAITKDGHRLASSGGFFWPAEQVGTATKEPHGEIRVWNLISGELLFDLPGVPDCIPTIAFSPDGSRLAAAVGKPKGAGGARSKHPGIVRIWEMGRGREVLTLGGFPGPVTGVAFSPNGQRIAAIGSGVLRIFDAGVPSPGP